jgi:hypothetical protein
MKKIITGLILFLSTTTSRAADIWTTRHFLGGNMEGEANPLTRELGLNWPQLVAVNVALTTLILGALVFYSLGRTKRLKHETQTVRLFGAYCLYNREMTLTQLICGLALGWPLPKDWYQALRYFGFIAPVAVVGGSLAAVFSWWAERSWDWRWVVFLRANFSIGYYSLFELLVATLFMAIGAYWFFRSEMRLARSA